VDALERLQRASVCVQEGARMFFGQSIDDLPSALRESAEKGQGTNGSS
jgi:hypothetical protein